MTNQSGVSAGLHLSILLKEKFHFRYLLPFLSCAIDMLVMVDSYLAALTCIMQLSGLHSLAGGENERAL